MNINEVHIPTVGGQSNVIGVFIETTLVNKRYLAILTQDGVNAPVPTPLVNDLGTIVWTRLAQGQYRGTLAGAFANAVFPNDLAQTSGGIASGGVQFVPEDDDSFLIETYDDLGVLIDDNLLNPATDRPFLFDLLISQPTLDGNIEGIFDVIISRLDANQLKIWTKIVVRNSGTITEIDGVTYRATNDFATSSKTIES